MRMKTILVAVDLSDVTMKVVKVAVHLAKPFQSKIILMHAVEDVPQISPIGTEPISVTVPLQDMPVDLILAQAENSRIDLIVLGSHDRGVFHHLFTGSVVDGILQRAKCPVLVVPLHDGGNF